MKIVTQRTGLSAHVLRVWERRYEAVTPERTHTNHRLYSEREIRRLELMAILTRGGYGISQIAKHKLPELEALAAELNDNQEDATPAPTPTPRATDVFQERAWTAVIELDGAGLQRSLDDATLKVGGSAMIEKVIVPLICRLGSAWDSGEISVAHERAASTVIQEALLLSASPHSETSGAPTLVIATPAGQLHELGAALVVCIARRRGWSVTYLGSSIPAEEIAHAASIKNALAVALSIVYPADDPGLPGEIERLRRLLPDECEILAGGRVAENYGEALEKVQATRLSDIAGLKSWLDSEREKRAAVGAT